MSDEPDLQVRRFLRRMELEPKVYEIVALTVAMCKAEVEAVIGTDLLRLKDGGSPWSRALLKTLDFLSEPAEQEKP